MQTTTFFLFAILFVPLNLFSFPLDSVFARGDSCLNVEWTPDSTNTKPDWYQQWGSLCTGSDSVYRHCDFTPGVTYRGICYSYGGEDPYNVFRDKVSRGLLVGSHLCHYSSFGDPTPVVAGSDCSGFVCYLWNVPRVATGSLVQRYTTIKKSELIPGDILVRSGYHTVLIVEAIDSTRFLIWEETSAVNGTRERIIDVNTSEWSAYVARRNAGIGAAVAGKSKQQPAPRFRVAIHGGKISVSVNITGQFGGTMEIRTLQGKPVVRQNIPAARGTIVIPVGRPLGQGMFLSTFIDETTHHEMTVPFMVMR